MGVGKMTAETVREYMSVTEMAERLGMSRSNLYALIDKGVFLSPIYLTANRQPFYPRHMVERNLLVRNTGLGINGQPIKFYRRRGIPASTQRHRITNGSNGRRRARNQSSGVLASLVNDLKALGLTSVTEDSAGVALTEMFPGGTAGVAEGDVIRAVFRRLRR